MALKNTKFLGILFIIMSSMKQLNDNERDQNVLSHVRIQPVNSSIIRNKMYLDTKAGE